MLYYIYWCSKFSALMCSFFRRFFCGVLLGRKIDNETTSTQQHCNDMLYSRAAAFAMPPLIRYDGEELQSRIFSLCPNDAVSITT